MPNNPKLFTLDKTTEDILRNQKNQSKYVRDAIKYFYSQDGIEEKPKPESRSKGEITGVII